MKKSINSNFFWEGKSLSEIVRLFGESSRTKVYRYARMHGW